MNYDTLKVVPLLLDMPPKRRGNRRRRNNQGPVQQGATGRPVQQGATGGPVQQGATGGPVQQGATGGPVQQVATNNPVGPINTEFMEGESTEQYRVRMFAALNSAFSQMAMYERQAEQLAAMRAETPDNTIPDVPPSYEDVVGSEEHRDPRDPENHQLQNPQNPQLHDAQNPDPRDIDDPAGNQCDYHTVLLVILVVLALFTSILLARVLW